MTDFIKLNNPPIKEIIFTISFKENISHDELTEFTSLPYITNAFPISNDGFHVQTEINQDGNKPPVTKVTSDGFILKSLDPINLVLQARRGSFSFHKVNGYENFGELLSKLKIYWNYLISVCGSLTVNTISVRYLNFIELFSNDDVNKLLTINTIHPFGSNLENSFTQFKFPYYSNPEVNIIVISTTGKIDNKDGAILDLILNENIKLNGDKLFDCDEFMKLRSIKNDLFFKCITEITINRYN